MGRNNSIKFHQFLIIFTYSGVFHFFSSGPVDKHCTTLMHIIYLAQPITNVTSGIVTNARHAYSLAIMTIKYDIIKLKGLEH